MAEPPPRTRDHHVPRMYLKRFAVHRSGGPQLMAVTPDLGRRFPVSVNDASVERGFYWGTDPEGVPQHDAEAFFGALESTATPAFRRLLDSGRHHTDDALPEWPPRSADRAVLSWWIAAQILRTVRQRSRLDVQDSGSVDLPNGFTSANRHLAYIAEMIQGLAAAVYYRPWGIGFSDFCLATGDVPVLVLNGQDHQNQSASVAYWDVYVPMDPHRCLYLPGHSSVVDKRLRHDHRFKLHGGLALGLNSMIIDTAVRHVFFHPEHDPTAKADPAIRTGDGQLPQFLTTYELMPNGYGVERRWLDAHPPPRPPSGSRDEAERDPVELVTQMAGELERRRAVFHQAPAPAPGRDAGDGDGTV